MRCCNPFAKLHREAATLVSAGAHIKLGGGDAPYVAEWFNNVNSAVPTVSLVNGVYVVDFGFSTANRFPVVVMDRNLDQSVRRPGMPHVFLSGNQVSVQVIDPGTMWYTAGEFYLTLLAGNY